MKVYLVGDIGLQIFKVFKFLVCFTLIGWLFSPQMWEILGLLGASRANVGRVTALCTFQIFLQKSVFIPANFYSPGMFPA